ncbi:PTS system, lactose-specific IIA component [Williamsoniiplasma luminosum]|uniref:PTS system lactose-specific EIIA component n=1 Tax=Williamsoniiplasma luminosum TaxID=214888 RepID=A0A2K8NUL5_9MOLU|nr:PTS lactose/cellobiose transporter subunit IIA [Williamsoniiplasma luminosum]ATZ17532.1 PTS system, lactose-specific IIA component [Williamsoniiplasma luminosum]AVP49348.1 MAG: PTS lactose/cellobiose transporter subunit IIA [Williamsoniiplasma luminosum]
MTKKEMSEKGMVLVGYSGDARSSYLIALKKAKEGKWKEVETLLAEGDEMLLEAHQAQTELLQAEAQEKYSDVTMIMVHGQDHLMTTVLLKDLIQTLLDVYRK